jgi:hypothetical protein
MALMNVGYGHDFASVEFSETWQMN